MCGAAIAEKCREQRAAFVGKHTLDDLDTMVEGWMVHDRKHRAAGARFRVARGEDQA